MANFLRGVCAALLALAMSHVQAALLDRGGGMIYDDVLRITWLQDANYAKSSGHDADGKMTWTGANAWADELRYGGFDDWRIAKTVQPDSSCAIQYDAGPVFGPQGYHVNCRGSELPYMYYDNFGAPAFGPVTASSHPENRALFTNIQEYAYWSATAYAPRDDLAWAFDVRYGNQLPASKGEEFYAWAVRDGDVIPEPTSMALLAFGLAGLALTRRRPCPNGLPEGQ